jgi:hypothetical protein
LKNSALPRCSVRSGVRRGLELERELGTVGVRELDAILPAVAQTGDARARSAMPAAAGRADGGSGRLTSYWKFRASHGTWPLRSQTIQPAAVDAEHRPKPVIDVDAQRPFRRPRAEPDCLGPVSACPRATHEMNRPSRRRSASASSHRGRAAAIRGGDVAHVGQRPRLLRQRVQQRRWLGHDASASALPPPLSAASARTARARA